MCSKLIYLFFLMSVLGLAEGQAQDDVWDRAVYWDLRYWTSWTINSRPLVEAFELAGYRILNAYQLKSWMNARIADRKLSVVVFCQDVAPETIVESMSSSCTLRRYLNAGGKIVWYADIPFYYQGHSNGGWTTWGNGGSIAILGFNASNAPWDTNSQVTLTDDGVAWGLTETWSSARATYPDVTDNLRVLATDGSGNAAAWVKHYLPGDNYRGFVRIFDRRGEPGFNDLRGVAEYAAMKASSPNPPDGAILSDISVSLGWSRSTYADSHDVYLGDNFDNVNDGTGGTFRGNQTSTFFVVGSSGFAYPDGLIPGTTYYWRIDEVEADGSTIHKGDVWSFIVTPRTAYMPIPADGAKFIEPHTSLSWNAGLGARAHHLYFGDNLADLEAGTGGAYRGSLGDASYTPGSLELEKTYYWRVDEFDGSTRYQGDVWSFTTAGIGGGLQGKYYQWSGQAPPSQSAAFPRLVMTRTDPQINFNWGNRSPGPSVNADNFSVRWTGKVEAAFTETYTFYTTTDDGVRLWVNGQKIIDKWIEQSATEWNGTIDLVAGQKYNIVMEYYENLVDAAAQLRWSSLHTPKQLVPQAALSPPAGIDVGVVVGVIELTDATFNQIVLSSDVPVLVDFWAPWCAPCLTMAPIIEEIANEYAGRAKICKLNVDNAPQTTTNYDIRFIPTFILFKDGRVQRQWVGVTSKNELTAAIQQLADSLSPDSLSEALDTALSFTTGGSSDWFAQTTTSRYGGDAAQSGDISHRQDSWMQTTVSGTGTLKFYWKVSSKEDFDFLEFYIDGSLQDNISGSDGDWEQQTYTISTSGSHTLEWRYVKDGSGDSGSDSGWVDKVEWVTTP